MKKFIVTYHAPAEILKRETNDAQDTEGGDIKAWETWAEKTGDHLLEFGSPAANGHELNKDGNLKPSNSDFCGYSILQAEDHEQAAELMRSNPHMNWDPSCTVEIHEILN
jgi:hypothetical protein